MLGQGDSDSWAGGHDGDITQLGRQALRHGEVRGAAIDEHRRAILHESRRGHDHFIGRSGQVHGCRDELSGQKPSVRVLQISLDHDRMGRRVHQRTNLADIALNGLGFRVGKQVHRPGNRPGQR